MTFSSILRFLVKRVDSLDKRVPALLWRCYSALFSQVVSVQQSGELVLGHEYIIDEVAVGDDFSNVGFVSPGVVFVATGATPTVWGNGTEVLDYTLSKPVLRVLNRDAIDFLCDFVWTREDVGVYKGVPVVPVDFLGLTSGSIGLGVGGYGVLITHDGYVELNFFDSTGAASDLVLDNAPLEIRVRRRGTPILLLQAFTNEVGDQVTLVFDKKISLQSVFSQLTFGGTASVFSSVVSVSRNVVVIGLDVPVESTDVVTLSCLAGVLESFNYGVFAELVDFPVVNNVPVVEEEPDPEA